MVLIMICGTEKSNKSVISKNYGNVTNILEKNLQTVTQNNIGMIMRPLKIGLKRIVIGQFEIIIPQRKYGMHFGLFLLAPLLQDCVNYICRFDSYRMDSKHSMSEDLRKMSVDDMWSKCCWHYFLWRAAKSGFIVRITQIFEYHEAYYEA